MATRSKHNGRAKPRGLRGQRSQRKVERSCQRSVLALARWCRARGMQDDRVAAMVGVSARTLRRWREQWRKDRLVVRPRGRPPDHADHGMRESILAIFHVMGPRVGLPVLRSLFPDVARGELQEMQRRYRRVYKRRHRFLVHALHWTRAGAVWAMDFADPPAPMEGVYRKIFCVRDLASGRQLAALPCPAGTAWLACKVLESLARWCGIPLAIKCDNASIFKSKEVRRWAEEHGVLLLYSPEGTPEYNGSIEAGIGSLKTRTFLEAACHDRPGDWTCDDMQAAMDQANETARPNGRDAPTPDEAWNERVALDDEQRSAFLETYRRHYQRECGHRGISWNAMLQHRERASVNRVAIGRALIDRGFLLIRRRRVSLPFKRRKAANIS